MLYGDANAVLKEKRSDRYVNIGSNLKLNFCLTTAAPPLKLSDKEVELLTMSETLGGIVEFKSIIAEQPQLQLVLNRKDLSKFVSDGKIGVILGLQNTPIDVDPQALFKAGVRVMCLAYYEENPLGSGFLNWGIGLKSLGRKFIEKCADVGMVIDLSHVGYQTALDTLVFIKKSRLNCRVMASHSGCVAVYPHMRNITDDLMKKIVDLGGVVGITSVTFNLDQRDNTINPFLEHLKHAIEVCGKENVVIGSDAIYGERTPEEGQEDMKKIAPRADPLGIQGIRYPETIYEGPKLMRKISDGISDLYTHNSEWSVFDPDEVERIMGKNLLNFFERALPPH